MYNFIQEHYISPEILASLQHALAGNTALFTPSQVYNAISDEKTIEPELRNSNFRTLTDKILFELCNKVLDGINEKNAVNKYNFLLFENDVMHIKYSQGEYFKVHEDYLSLDSNLIEEYSMIICINADCVGGETVLHLNENFKYPSRASVTPGSCLLFRKDIPHEGSVLQSGCKEIITFNVWRVLDESQQVVIVKFDNSDKTCAIPANKIIAHPEDTLLKVFLNTKLGSGKESPVIFFNSNCTYDEFKVIEKIYNGCAISCDELSQYREIIDYYLFDYQKLLVKNFSAAIHADSIITPLSYSLSQNDNIMLFNHEGTYLEFVEQIKINNLSYVPFKMLLVEGSLSYGGEMSGTPTTHIKMMPCMVSFSERNNVMYYCNPMTTRSIEKKYYNNTAFVDHIDEQCLKKFKNIKHEGSMEITGYDDYFDDENMVIVDYSDYDFNGKSIHFNLGVILQGDPIKSVIIPQQLSMKVKKASAYSHRPFGDNSIYYIDSKNRLSLKSYHYGAIINKVEDLKLYEYVISKLNSMELIHPQKTNAYKEHFYCNENVYGRFSFLVVYGAIKI